MSFAQSADNLTPDSDSLIDVNYVYLYTRGIVKAESIVYEDNFLISDYFLVDGKKFKLNEVKFYQTEAGFFGNVKDVGFQSGFAERTQSGDINLFELEVQHSSAPMMNANGVMTGGYGGTSIIDYYNKGFGNLKRANYENLSVDLNDKPEAKLYLDEYNKIRMTQNGFYIAGGAFMIGAFAAFLNQPDPQNFDMNRTFLFAGLGAASGFTAYIIGMNKKIKLEEAIRAYNGF